MKRWSHTDEEIFEFMRITMKTERNIFIEIGTYKFDFTALLMMLTTGDNPMVIGVDHLDWAPERKKLLEEFFPDIFRFILGDSRATRDPKEGQLKAQEGIPIVDEQIQKLLDGRLADVMFIDSNHDARALGDDILNHVQHVKPEGYVIFHDARKIWEPHRTKVPGTATNEWFLRRLSERYPLSLHFIEGSLIAYIQAKEWVEGKALWERDRRHHMSRGKK